MATSAAILSSFSAAILSSFSPVCSNSRPYRVAFNSSKRSSFVCSLTLAEPHIVNDEASTDDNGSVSVACPVCFHKLTLIRGGVTFSNCSSETELTCTGCRKTYSGKESHLELAIPTPDPYPLFTELFRLPLVSFAYERGWRQSFAVGGFPGPEKEFEMMKKYLDSASNGSIVDASCGSGLFSRIFSKSGMFSFVVAHDFSENMLQQCRDFIRQDDLVSRDKIMLVRSDMARLPFVTGSVDAVHAGAAMHCWPSPVLAVAEICRVLKPGGVFVGTTYVWDGKLSGLPLLEPMAKGFTNVSGLQAFLNEREIEYICTSCGLVDYKSERSEQFIMFSAKKSS